MERQESTANGPHALLAAGGTGGHIFPALAVGEALAARGWAVTFTGPDRPLEARLAAERGIEFAPLAAKPVLGQGVVGKARALTTLAGSAIAARRLIRRLGSRVVIGTGGYAVAPAVLGARLARCPVYLIEPNAHAGLANRKLSRFAAEAAVAFDVTRSELACPSRVTGVPVRREFFDLPALAAPGDGPLRLLVLGGSQGARQINELVPAALSELLADEPDRPIELLHQCGRDHLGATETAYLDAGLGGALEAAGDAQHLHRVRVTRFIDDVAGALAGVHLVICRAGALTVAELAAAGRPSILVPLAIAGAHQLDNARVLADQGAARLLEPGKADVETLTAHLRALAADPSALVTMGEKARSLAHPQALSEIADRVEAIASGEGGAR